MTHPSEYAPVDLLPHRPPMVLIDSILGFRNDWFGAGVTIGPESQFGRPDGCVPAWVGLEYMAQTIGALVGLRRRETGQPVRLGLLLGCRRSALKVTAYQPGQRLSVWCLSLLEDEVVGSFNCRIEDTVTTAELMSAVLTVYQPEDFGPIFDRTTRDAPGE